jgi:hypothetical protein
MRWLGWLVSLLIATAADGNRAVAAGPAADGEMPTPADTAGGAGPVPLLEPDLALLARIAALPENTWMKLPPVKTAGDLSWLAARSGKRTYGPNGRDYSNEMVWAPERRRALFCGGGHNIDPINDVWEYDLAANTWVCLSAADPVYPHRASDEVVVEYAGKHAVFKDGVVRTKRGGPLRPAHTWDGLCYNPDRRLMLWLEPHQGLVFTNRPALAKGLGMSLDAFNAQRKPGSYIWAFRPATRRWVWVQTGLRGGEGAIMLYIPDRKRLWIKSGTRAPAAVTLYDPQTQTGKALSSHGMPGYGTVAAYDPHRKTVVVLNVKQTYTYSLEKDEWKTVQQDAPAGGRDASCHFHYDPVARCFVLFTRAVTPNLWLYDPKTNRWTDPRPKGDVPPSKGRLVGYYDPARNVTVHYDGRSVWVYRCRADAAFGDPSANHMRGDAAR